MADLLEMTAFVGVDRVFIVRPELRVRVENTGYDKLLAGITTGIRKCHAAEELVIPYGATNRTVGKTSKAQRICLLNH